MFSIRCLFCVSSFSTRRVLFSHQRSVHNISPDVLGKIYCPWCAAELCSEKILRRHMQSSHGLRLVKELFTFDSMEEFYEWKSKMESKTNTSYMSHNTLRQRLSGVKTVNFHCHKTGLCTAVSRGKPYLASQEMQATCPSLIYVTEDQTSKNVNVVFWNVHAGCGEEFLHPFSTEEEIARAHLRARIYEDHLESHKITEAMMRELSKDSWRVFSSTSDAKYVVQRVKHPTCTSCDFNCYACNVCVHMFECSCRDRTVKKILCRHIHACIRLNQMEFLFDESDIEDEVDNSMTEIDTKKQNKYDSNLEVEDDAENEINSPLSPSPKASGSNKNSGDENGNDSRSKAITKNKAESGRNDTIEALQSREYNTLADRSITDHDYAGPLNTPSSDNQLQSDSSECTASLQEKMQVLAEYAANVDLTEDELLKLEDILNSCSKIISLNKSDLVENGNANIQQIIQL